jgi:hypothetical protein
MEGNLMNVFLNVLISATRGHCDYSSQTQKRKKKKIERKKERKKKKEKILVDMHFPILGPPLTIIRCIKSSPAPSDKTY